MSDQSLLKTENWQTGTIYFEDFVYEQKRIVIFASGRGSNAEAIHEACENGTVNGEVVGVICDHAGAQVLERARRWNVPSTVIELKSFENKAAFNNALLEAAVSYKPDLICLAGYMRICGENLIHAFPNRIINIHPALLPSFRGLHAQRQAIEAGVKVAGCTVHFVGTGLDDGPIITQTAVPSMMMIRKTRCPPASWNRNILPTSALSLLTAGMSLRLKGTMFPACTATINSD